VILSHRAVVSTVASLMTFIDTLTPGKGNFLDENDVFLSFLPLAHIFDR
jgi:long-subunit acyl-CoA synthetase (AMP-forming)